MCVCVVQVPEKVEQHRRCVNRLMKDNIAQILVFDAITPEVSSAQGPGISTSSSDTPRYITHLYYAVLYITIQLLMGTSRCRGYLECHCRYIDR